MLCSSDRKEDTVERKGIGEYERDDDRVKGRRAVSLVPSTPLTSGCALPLRTLFIPIQRTFLTGLVPGGHPAIRETRTRYQLKHAAPPNASTHLGASAMMSSNGAGDYFE